MAGEKGCFSGSGPVKAKKLAIADSSFGAIYQEWYEHKKQVWSLGYANELARMFRDDILSMIGHLRINEIEPMKILEVIRRFEERGALERANKARRRCGEVFGYAIVTGRAKYNPAPDLADAMKGYRKQNYPFLPALRLPAFVDNVVIHDEHDVFYPPVHGFKVFQRGDEQHRTFAVTANVADLSRAAV